jgi:GNAT superfamily N-acetyltransferase
VLDNFPSAMSIRDIVDLINAVGFGSPPAWFRPFHTLSTGEQFRVSCARRLAEAPQGEIVLIDEFTSVVDRQVAQVASHALQKTVRRAGRQLVAVTCHYDVVDWLQPDWVYQPHANEFTWRSVQPRPRVELDVYPISRAAWRIFSPHHYLSAEHMPGAKCFGMFVGDECVAYQSYRHFMHASVSNMKITHRLVVLPDWQGLGLALVFANWMGQYLYDQGWRYRVVTAHPAMIAGLNRSPRWRLATATRRLQTTTKNAALRRAQLNPRRLNTYSFEYAAPIKQLGAAESPEEGELDSA